MYETEPRQIGGVLDAGVRLYRGAFKGVAATAAKGFGALFIVEVVSEFALGVSTMSYDASTDPSGAQAVTYLAFAFFVLLPLTIVTSGAVVQHLHAFAEGEAEPATGAYSRALRRVPALIGYFILYFLAVMVGLVLFVIPGLWLSIAFAMGFYLIFTEGLGPIDALKRSRAIVEGNWFRTAVVATVGTIMALVIQVGVVQLPAGVAGYLAAGGTEIGTVWLVGLNFLNAIAQVIAVPLAAALGLALTRDLVLRRSGDDLQARLDAA